MKYILVTNNPLVSNHYKAGQNKWLTEVRFQESWTMVDVMSQVRDAIHRGHQLLTHPLTGSVKPGETPYKSICISAAIEKMSLEDLKIIEDSLSMTKEMVSIRQRVKWTESLKIDFQTIDFHLIESGIESIQGGR